MQEIIVGLSDPQFEKLNKLAHNQNQKPSGVAADIVIAWLDKQEPVSSDEEETQRRRFLKLRTDGKSYDEICRELECAEEQLRDWDNEIKTIPRSWNKAFIQVRKSTNPVLWEMKIMDRFYELWGRHPSSSTR